MGDQFFTIRTARFTVGHPRWKCSPNHHVEALKDAPVGNDLANTSIA